MDAEPESADRDADSNLWGTSCPHGACNYPDPRGLNGVGSGCLYAPDDQLVCLNLRRSLPSPGKSPMARLLPSLFGPSDEQIMWRVKMEDDVDAFDRLVAKWQAPLEQLCTRLTGDAHRAEDLVQVAFSRVFDRRTEYVPKGKFSTFLWRIAINLCHDELRRKSTRGECSLEELSEDGRGVEFADGATQSPDAVVETRERGELVRQALLELAPQHRELIVLRHYEQMKFSEIAELLNIPESTAKTRLAEALTQLNRRLKFLREDLSCAQKDVTPEGR